MILFVQKNETTADRKISNNLKITEQWNKYESVRFRTGWEQARFIAHCCLTPYMGQKKLSPTDIIRFDWEKETKKTVNNIPSEEDFERLKRQYG